MGGAWATSDDTLAIPLFIIIYFNQLRLLPINSKPGSGNKSRDEAFVPGANNRGLTSISVISSYSFILKLFFYKLR